MEKFYLHFMLVIFGYTSALTDEEALIKFGKFLIACSKSQPVDMVDLMKLQQLQPPTKPEVKCLLACAYRKFGTLKSDGMFDLEASYKLAEEAKEGDEKRLENGKKLADTCVKVNDEKVSDGEKGCERATLMFKCITTNAPKMGFKVQLEPDKIQELGKLMQ